MLFSKVPIVALKELAAVNTINFIIENLHMYDTKMFLAIPERSSIRNFVNAMGTIAVYCINYWIIKG